MVQSTVPLDLTSLHLEGVDLPSALLRAVTHLEVSRTVDGASTVVVECDDAERKVLRLPVIAAPGTVSSATRARRRQQTRAVTLRRESKALGSGALPADSVVLTFAGLAYVLVQVATGAGTTTLTFEDSVISLLRQQTGLLVAERGSVTRSEFILRLAAAAGVPARVQTDERIPVLNPAAQLNPVDTSATGDTSGDSSTTTTSTSTASTFDPSAGTSAAGTDPTVTVPGASAGSLTPTQIAGLLLGAGCPSAQVATYTAIALYESGGGNPLAVNHANTDGSTDYGLFQINSSHSDLLGAGDKFDPAANTVMAKTISSNWTNPPNPPPGANGQTPWSSYNSGVYSKYLPIATAAAGTATATTNSSTPTIGDGGTSTTSITTSSNAPAYVDSGKRGRVLGTGQWQRGTQAKPDETSWEAIVRLAQELNWRAFSDGQTLWVGSDAWLRGRRGPPLGVHENRGGIGWLMGEWDPGKVNGNDLSLTTHAPWPGQTAQNITVTDMGRLSGQWLCHSYVQATTDREAVQVNLSRAQDDALATVSTSSSAVDLSGVTAGGEPAGPKATKALAAAESKIGADYVYGAIGPATFDCSGLMEWAYAQAGVRIPRSTFSQWSDLPHMTDGNYLPGDLILYDNGEPMQPGHVAMYVGGGQVVDAPHTGAKVKYDDLNFMPIYGAVRPTTS